MTLWGFLLQIIAKEILLSVLHRARRWVVRLVKRRRLSPTSEAVVNALDTYSSKRIHSSISYIRHVGYIPRPQEDEVISSWQGGTNAILLTGQGGSGKSTVAGRIGQKLSRIGTPVLFVDASEFPSSKEPLAILEARMPLSSQLTQSLSDAGRETECYIIIDQLDSLGASTALGGFTSWLRTLNGMSGIRTLAVSRTHEANEFSLISELNTPRINLDELNVSAVEHHLQELGISSPPDILLDLGRNLLNLSLIADIARDAPDFSEINTEIQLWDKFAETIADREGTGVLLTAIKIASYLTISGDDTYHAGLFPSRHVRSLVSRGILIPRSRTRFAFRHENLQSFLCAYGALEEGTPAEKIFAEYGEAQGRRIVQSLVGLLQLYDPEREALLVENVLSDLKDKLQFYTRVSLLDVLREQQDPDLGVAETLADILSQESSYSRYFFHDLENPAWIRPLHQVSFLARVPDPVEVEPGSFRMTPWDAGTYLRGVAESFPDIVVEVASTVQSDNTTVLHTVLDALVEIPAQEAARAAANISKWFPPKFRWFDFQRLAEYLRHLVDNGFADQALVILDSLLTMQTPQPPEGTGGGLRPYVSIEGAIEDYSLEQVWSAIHERVIHQSPYHAHRILADRLVGSIETERKLQGREATPTWSSWRSAIEDHPQNTSLSKLRDILVDGARDSLNRICEIDPGEGRKILRTYLASDHSILRRLALHSLTHFGPEFEELAEQVLTDRDNYEDSSIHHEFFWLLNRQFPHLSGEDQDRVVEWLFDGPEDTSELVEAIRMRNADADVEQELAKYLEYWTLRRIWAIRAELKGDPKARFNALVEKLGEPDHPDFLSWFSGFERTSPTSPMTSFELGEASFEEIRDLIEDHEPESPSIVHSRGGLGEALQAAVMDSPAKFAEFSQYLMSEDVPSIYVYHFLAAYTESIKETIEFDIDAVLDLCQYAVNLEDAPQPPHRNRYEPGIRQAHLQIARLIEALTEAEGASYDVETLDRIRSIIESLLESPDPSDDLEEMREGWDPSTRSLNSVRGLAMHALIKFARYQDQRLKEEAEDQGEEHEPYLDPFVRDQLKAKLDKSNDDSPTVHAVLGWYMPLIDYYDHEWVQENLGDIFPEGDVGLTYWTAAWDAYLSFNRVYARPFRMLIPQYHRAISRLNQPSEHTRPGRTSDQRLAQHIMAAYLQELIDLESHDGLMKAFFEEAQDQLRGHVAAWLSGAFGEGNLDRGSTRWARMWALMQARIDEALDRAGERSYNAEISHYMRWLDRIPIEFSELEPYLRKAISFVEDGYYKKLVLDYLAANVAQEPLAAAEILHEVLRIEHEGWLSLREENVGAILQAAMESGEQEAIEIAVQAINMLGERGDFRWKRYLPDEDSDQGA